jgi:formylglycine-generating enzyme required for sulfatase activity/serine/threonine protein phosphatase PrpC
MALEFELAGSQIDGARDYQEDAFLITNLTDANGKPSALVVIADGMGGHAAGNVASNMAVQAFNKHVSANYPTDNIADILEQSVVKANNSIKETVAETPALSGMGCTMVAAILEEGKMWWASVGDSHCYLIRDRKLEKKNADHSYGGFLDRMEAEGTPVEPEPGLSRNMLMSAITGDDINEIDVSESPLELQADDKVVLCSDGLDTLSSGKIIQYSDWSESPKECADALMQAVEEANMPRQDNTTAVVVSVKDTNAAAAVEEEATTEDKLESTSNILEATSEFSADEIAAENAAAETEPVTVDESLSDAIQEAANQESIETFDQPKSKTGLFIGIAAAIVVVIGAGIFFTMGGDKSPQSSDATVADVETEMEEVVEEVIEDEPEVVEAVEETDEATEVVAETTTEETKPVEKAVATAPTEATFQDNLKSGGKGPVMVWVPAGDYSMGSNKQQEESPKHTVSIRKFAVSEKEISIAQYSQYAKATGAKVPKTKGLNDEFPVFSVSWDDAYNYVKWLSKETGEKYRLLSESEWEYAASGGKKTPFWWGYNMEPNKAHCFLGCNQELNTNIPMKVGSFEANPFGLYDMSGNVSEWVHDCWHPNYKGAPSDESVWEGGDCTQRVVRGGAYISPEQSLRTASRDKFKSNSSYEHIGIRVARED